jgi:hypothetical protein
MTCKQCGADDGYIRKFSTKVFNPNTTVSMNIGVLCYQCSEKFLLNNPSYKVTTISEHSEMGKVILRYILHI